MEAYVRGEQAAVRSGPGPDYYATDHLAGGTRVEVYRRDAGGWLAIRPPEGSYSLVAASQLEMTSRKGVARVVGTQPVAWVATRHGPVANHKWQVQLNAGEFVRVLGEQQLTLFEGGELQRAYRIAPPSGEFRWIHEDDADSHPPVTPNAAKTVKTAETVNAAETVNTTSPGPGVDEDGVPAVELTDYRILIESDGSSSTAPRVADTRPVPPSDSAAWRPKKSSNQRVAGNDNVQRVSPARPLGDSDVLRKIDVQLSLIVSRSPEQWNLAPLRQLALEMIDNGDSALERGRARLLLEKITQFAEVQQRYRNIGSTGVAASQPTGVSKPPGVSRSTDATNAAGIGPIGAGGSIAAGEPAATSTGVTYDAQGVLVPVHSRTGRAPPYALVDANGRVLKYVSPSPGLNLHRYLGKQIGVMGQRGYLPSIEARHVTAHRVIQLDRHLR